MSFEYSHLQIIICVVTLTLGYLVWTYNAQNYLNRILSLIILCFLLLDISLFLNLRPERFLNASIILGSLGISFFAPLFYILSLFYPRKKSFKRVRLYLIVFLTALFSVLMVVLFPRAKALPRPAVPDGRWALSFRNIPFAFLALYFLLTVYSLFLLFLAARNFLLASKERVIKYERNTLILLLSIGVPFGYVLSTVSLINYFFVIPFPWLGILLGAFSFFLVILIFRFHLVDFRRFVYGIVIYPSFIGVLVFIYSVFVLKNHNEISRTLGIPESITLILEAFLIYLAASTIRRFLNVSTLRKRFKLLSSSRLYMVEPLEYLSYAYSLEELYRRLREVIDEYFGIKNIYLLLLDEEKLRFQSIGKEFDYRINPDSDIIKVLGRLGRGVTLEELSIYLNDREDIVRLSELGINLILPILKDDRVFALLLLPKLGVMKNWSYDDISTLNNLRVLLPALITRSLMYEHEKMIEKHQMRMEQLNVMAQMASGLAHEIRNPLSIIVTSVETLLKDEIPEEDKKKMLEFILEETNRINVMLNKILSLNFEIKPDIRSIDIQEIFKKLKAFLQYKLKDRKIEYEIENGQPLRINTDENMLFQILLNLSLNSIEAMEEGGKISIDYAKKGNVVCIYFCDSGPGIPPELREKIFEPFFTTKSSGSGLGLTVTKKLVEKLQGNLEFLDYTGGCTFLIEIPA